MKKQPTAVITHDGLPRAYRICRCSVCGTEAECTPRFDFYGSNGAPLKCETCFERTVLRPLGVTGWLDTRTGRVKPFRKDDA